MKPSALLVVLTLSGCSSAVALRRVSWRNVPPRATVDAVLRTRVLQQPPPDLSPALFSLDEIAQPRDTLFSLDAADGKSEVQRDACAAVVRAFGSSSCGDDDAGVGGGPSAGATNAVNEASPLGVLCGPVNGASSHRRPCEGRRRRSACCTTTKRSISTSADTYSCCSSARW